MSRDVSLPLAADEPVAVALNEPAIRTRLVNAARAFLGKRAAALTPIQRGAEAEAVAQEAIARAWKNRDQFDASKDVVKWLVGFVVNVARESAKKRCRDATGPLADGLGLEALAVDPARPADDAITDKLLAGQLLDRLPPGDREIVQLKYWEDLTCAEIGERIGLRENAVRVRLHRALLKLKRASGVAGEGQP
jgi:RNA polymerase sigma-70 factor (ECF subfamily)